MVPAHEAPATVAQPEQRVELLDELECEPSPAADRSSPHDPPPGEARPRVSETRCRGGSGCRRAGHRPGPGGCFPAGLKLLDQPVLEHQRSQLRARRPVVDDRRVAGPVRPGADGAKWARARLESRSTCPRTGCSRRRRETGRRRVPGKLAEVDLGHRAGSSLQSVLPGASAGAAPRDRRGFSSSSASRIVVEFAHSRGNSAHRTRAHVSASGSARCAPGPRSQARPPGQRVDVRAGAGASSSPARPYTAPADRASLDRSARMPGAERGDRTARCARPSPVRRAAGR